MATTVDDEVVPPLVPNEMLAGRGASTWGSAPRFPLVPNEMLAGRGDASCLPRKLGNDAAEGG
jgi:hypothetical protein